MGSLGRVPTFSLIVLVVVCLGIAVAGVAGLGVTLVGAHRDAGDLDTTDHTITGSSK